MTVLAESLKKQMRQNGPIDVGKFMSDTVAYYYSHNKPFGQNGDFTTAPEISQMFGEVIGAWVADYWIKLGQPEHFLLIELGPGKGTLMADMLRATKNVPGFHKAMEIILIENSPSLTKIQKETLAGYSVTWLEQMDYERLRDKAAPVIIIGNEFFDALPVRQFQMSEKGWRERMVALNEQEEFIFGLGPVADSIAVDLPKSASADDIYEISPVRISCMSNIAALVKKCGGGALFIDYGYDEQETPVKGDTLQAVKNHDFVPVLSDIGMADLTSHVDFHALRIAAEQERATVFGAVEQGRFLQELGIGMRAQMLCRHADDKQVKDIESAYERLCAPDQMGALFKVMAITHDPQFIPAGF